LRITCHDRAFLRALTRATLWIDRGQVRRQEQGFDRFEEWRDKLWEEEDQQRHKLNRKIKAEARWAVEGISARRKRNQGRVLQGLWRQDDRQGFLAKGEPWRPDRLGGAKRRGQNDAPEADDRRGNPRHRHAAPIWKWRCSTKTAPH